MPLFRKPPPGDVRRVQSNGRNLRYTITNKVGRLVQCESQLERKLTLLLERDKQVRDYASQPEILNWYDEQGKEHSYVPDFIVWYQDGRVELHEVTITKRQSDSHQQNRQMVAQSVCQQRGWHYLIHTEETLPDETVTANLLVLYAYRGAIYANQHMQQLVTKCLQLTARTVQETYQQLQIEQDIPYATFHMSLLHMLWHGVIQTEMDDLLFQDGKLRSDLSLEVKGGAV